MPEELSPSAISMWTRCQTQWKFRYLEGYKEPPGAFRHLGTSFHSTVEANHLQKVKTRTDLPTDEMEDRFDQKWREVPESEIDWKNEKPAELKDDGVKIVRLYAKETAPEIMPKLVEQRIFIPLEGPNGEPLPRLHMKLDVMDENDKVFDMKTASKKPDDEEVHGDDQMTAYAAAALAMKVPAPIRVELDYHVRPSANFRLGRVFKNPSERSEDQVRTWYGHVAAVADQIQHAERTGMFQLANPSAWWCSENWCGYWWACPGGAARRTQHMVRWPKVIEGGVK